MADKSVEPQTKLQSGEDNKSGEGYKDSDFLPRVSCKMHVKSLPANEGIMRLTGLLSANQIVKKLDTTPIAVNGNLGSDAQKDAWQDVSKMKAKVKKLNQLYQKI